MTDPYGAVLLLLACSALVHALNHYRQREHAREMERRADIRRTLETPLDPSAAISPPRTTTLETFGRALPASVRAWLKR